MHVIQGNQIWAKRIEIWHCCYIIPAVAQSCCMEAFDSFLCTEIRIRPEISLLWMSISQRTFYWFFLFSLSGEWQLTAECEKTLTETPGPSPAPPCVVTLVAAVDIKHQVCEDPGVYDREMWFVMVIWGGLEEFQSLFSEQTSHRLKSWLVGSRKNREQMQNRVMTDLSI